MFPVDSDFLILYSAYGAWLLLLAVGFLFSGHRKRYITHLILYAIYFTVMVCVFANGQNFKYGSSLLVLFYGAIFLLVHVVAFIIQGIYRFFTSQRQTNKL